MSQTIINPEETKQLCFYINLTLQMQVVKIADEPNFEKVILPYEKLLFHAFESSKLKIYAESSGKIALLKSIYCRELKI